MLDNFTMLDRRVLKSLGNLAFYFFIASSISIISIIGYRQFVELPNSNQEGIATNQEGIATNQDEIALLNKKLKALEQLPQNRPTIIQETTIIKQIRYGIQHPKQRHLSKVKPEQWLGNKVK